MSAAQQQPSQADRAGGAQPPSAPEPAQRPDVYRSRVALVAWWVWVAFALANLVDLAIGGRTHFALVVALILLAITGVAFVTGFRPRLAAGDEGLMISNPLRAHQVPWGCVESMDLGDSLEVRCRWQGRRPRRKKLYCWAVHSPRRNRFRAEMRARRKVSVAQRRSPSPGRLPPEAQAAMAMTEEEHIVMALRARADRARVTGAAGGQVVSRWDWLAIAVLVIPAVALLVVALT